MKILLKCTLLFALLLPACNGQDKPQQQEEKITIPKVDLHSAVVTDDLDVIKRHIKAGSDLNVLEPSRASTPLITAAALGNKEAALLLLEAGADTNYQNLDGSTALHTAAAFGKTEVAKVLINAGINLDLKNNQGATSLHTAAFLCREDIVKVLLENGADKSIKNGTGRTAYETVAGPFENVKAIYDAVSAGLRPLGVVLDYDHIKKSRPVIAQMLK